MENYVKTGLVKGFSIEGYFTDRLAMSAVDGIEENEATEMLFEIHDLLESQKYKLETYSDYPEGAVNNAKRVLEWVKENGWGSCGTAVGKRRASQLASKSKITVSTIKRMYSFLSRHAKDLEVSKSYSDGCGKLMYDAWGGKAALRWARGKLKDLGEIEMAEVGKRGGIKPSKKAPASDTPNPSPKGKERLKAMQKAKLELRFQLKIEQH